ncbi:hypothetical protein SAMN04489715_0768 [Schaalia meyeri]|nr:hypothetical protein SAMN04489715_0768 [Schaalia meyeri]
MQMWVVGQSVPGVTRIPWRTSYIGLIKAL